MTNLNVPLKKILAGCGVALFSLLTALPVQAQVAATLVLRDGQRPSGELVDLNASGFTLRTEGQTQHFDASDVASVEFTATAPPRQVQDRIDGGEPLIVLRNGQVVEGRLSDIGGTRPLRLTVEIPDGRRDFTSNNVAQIYLHPIDRPAQTAALSRMRFEAMDLNNDGVVSRDEWRGSARSFEVHDWNNDGRLAGDEVRTGAQQAANVDGADHTPSWAERYTSWTDAGFANLDHNGDRRIGLNEWHYARETFLRADRNRDGMLDRLEFLGADMDDDRGNQFVDLDVNRNNRIERTEWHASEDAFVWLDRDRNGTLSRLEVVGDDNVSSSTDQFASLDYDRNGTIGRNEWHWSSLRLTQRDLNRDGVLSRSEYVPTTDSAVATTLSSQAVRVSAQQTWTPTDIAVRAGDVLMFSSQGSIRLSPTSADVATPGGALSGRRAPGAPVDGPAGALIARIGDNMPFLVGNRASVPVAVTGPLYLGVNDDHMPDNSGEFQVAVSVQRRGQ